jgi:hypothetical protein
MSRNAIISSFFFVAYWEYLFEINNFRNAFRVFLKMQVAHLLH